MEIMFKKYIFFIPILLLEILWCLSNVNESYLKYYNHVSSQLSNSLLNFIERSMSTHKHNNEEFVILARCLGEDNRLNSEIENKRAKAYSLLMEELKNKFRENENSSPSSVEYNTETNQNDDQPTVSKLTPLAPLENKEKTGLFSYLKEFFTKSERKPRRKRLKKTDIGSPILLEGEDLKKALSHDKFRIDGALDNLYFKTHPPKKEVSRDEHLPDMPSESYDEPPKSPTKGPTPMPRSRKPSIKLPNPRPRQNSRELDTNEVNDDNDVARQKRDVTQANSTYEPNSTSLVKKNELNLHHKEEDIKKQYIYDENKEKRYFNGIQESCDGILPIVEDYKSSFGSKLNSDQGEQSEDDDTFYKIWMFLTFSPETFMKGIQILTNARDGFIYNVYNNHKIGVKSPEFYITVNLDNNSLKENFEIKFTNATINTINHETCLTLHANMNDLNEDIVFQAPQQEITVNVCGPGNLSGDSGIDLSNELINLRFGSQDHFFYIKSEENINQENDDFLIVYIQRPFDVMELFVKSFLSDDINEYSGNDDLEIYLSRLPSTNHSTIEISLREGSSYVKVVLPCWQCIIYPVLEEQMEFFFNSITKKKKNNAFIFTLHDVDRHKFINQLQNIRSREINNCVRSINSYIHYTVWNYVNVLLYETELNLSKIILVAETNKKSCHQNSGIVKLALSNVYFKNAMLTVTTDKYRIIPVPLMDFRKYINIPWILKINNYFRIKYPFVPDSQG